MATGITTIQRRFLNDTIRDLYGEIKVPPLRDISQVQEFVKDKTLYPSPYDFNLDGMNFSSLLVFENADTPKIGEWLKNVVRSHSLNPDKVFLYSEDVEPAEEYNSIDTFGFGGEVDLIIVDRHLHNFEATNMDIFLNNALEKLSLGGSLVIRDYDCNSFALTNFIGMIYAAKKVNSPKHLFPIKNLFKMLIQKNVRFSIQQSPTPEIRETIIHVKNEPWFTDIEDQYRKTGEVIQDLYMKRKYPDLRVARAKLVKKLNVL